MLLSYVLNTAKHSANTRKATVYFKLVQSWSHESWYLKYFNQYERITDAKLSKYNYIYCINLLWYKLKKKKILTGLLFENCFPQCLHVFSNLSFLWNVLQQNTSLLVHFLAQLSSHSFNLIWITHWLQMYKKHKKIGNREICQLSTPFRHHNKAFPYSIFHSLL